MSSSCSSLECISTSESSTSSIMEDGTSRVMRRVHIESVSVDYSSGHLNSSLDTINSRRHSIAMGSLGHHRSLVYKIRKMGHTLSQTQEEGGMTITTLAVL